MINGVSDINVKTVHAISNLFRPDEEGESAETEAAAEKRASEKEPWLRRVLMSPYWRIIEATHSLDGSTIHIQFGILT